MNTVVFTFNINNKDDYSVLGNFIHKRENHSVLQADEVEKIKYNYYNIDGEKSYSEWTKIIIRDREKFKQIEQPYRIKNINDNYKVIYCVFFDVAADIVELQNLYLLKRCYNNLSFFFLCENWKTDDYYRISQYLFTINITEKEIYNSLFFMENGKVKRCQINNVTFSRKFIPMQAVTGENVRRLFGKCKDVISKEDFLTIFSEDKKLKIQWQESDILEGAKKILHENQKQFSNINSEQLYALIKEMDLFAFVLFCYTIDVKQESLSGRVIKRRILQVRQYSHAMRQLCENIVFHSDSKCGCISVRLHDSKTDYFQNMYMQTYQDNDEEQYLEILVSDFNADNKSGNIAENFVAGMTNEIQKKDFTDMTPASFFNQNISDLSKERWNKFYEDPDNIGKHFGLKIFQSIIRDYKGFFIAESHSGYKTQMEEEFSSFERQNETILCLPGTRYAIALPLVTMNQIIVTQDQSLDRGINICENIGKILSYKSSTMSMEWGGENYESQNEKNELIVSNSKEFETNIKESQSDIIYVSLKNLEEDKAELYIKAVIIALYRLKKSINFVFYNCTDGLKRSLFSSLQVFMCEAELPGMFSDIDCQIALFSDEYEEAVVVLNGVNETNNVNAYIEHMKCIALSEWYMQYADSQPDVNAGARIYIPYDVLGEVEIDGENRTLFEHYTYDILKESIQSEKFGCKITNTHMRLGSTIHIDQFYEAELLFDNKLFVSRFALLLVKEMQNDIKDVAALTLYGYGTYSETVLVQAVEMIRNLYSDKKDIDYIILERVEERRSFLHKDRIRYNRSFSSTEERKAYFANRKIAVIVLINSTLKTHVRLISLFKDENNIEKADKDWILRNYAVLLVGKENNEYWKLSCKNISMQEEKIIPAPQYFIRSDAIYYEPLKCELCFPKNPVAEFPLIEVNAASTIPNQAFGIKKNIKSVKKIAYSEIEREEAIINKLKDCLVYAHVQRNENHFLYYFKTEKLWINEKSNIQNSLDSWKEKWEYDFDNNYNIIVAPMHFSNAGFVELVNNQVFNGNAILMRVDFDKEYRSNAHAKFSYLRNYIRQMKERGNKAIIRVHYVDDCIISGRTFYRAKSLVHSVLDSYKRKENDIEIRIFDKVFVLVDRNSPSSRMQYIQNWNNSNMQDVLDEYFYSFINVEISSLRNYGDSCVYCNLGKEARLLHETASTVQVSEYWKNYIEKFKLHNLDDYEEESGRREREFRRLFCTHMTQVILDENEYGNSTENAMYLILNLLNEDYINRDVDQFEYFMSYLKCISRPFLVFKKPIKEAIFDILLIIIDAIVRDLPINEVMKEIDSAKPYLKNRKIVLEFNRLNDNILKSSNRTFEEKGDLVKLVMKQLTELKSNYIICPEKMNKIFEFMSKHVEIKEFQAYYMSLIKRLVGVSSDTAKSTRLDNILLEQLHLLSKVPPEFITLVLLENTRAFRDGLEKLYIKLGTSERFKTCIENQNQRLISEQNKGKSNQIIKRFLIVNREELNNYSEGCLETEDKIKKLIKQLDSLDETPWWARACSLARSCKNWRMILDGLQELEEEFNEEANDTQDIAELKNIFNEETNVFQYGSFNAILRHNKYLENEKITDRGVAMLSACLSVLLICRSNQDKSPMKLKEQVQQIAIMFNVILASDKVQFAIEKKEESELDNWRQLVEDEFNQNIIDKYNELIPTNDNRLDRLEIIKYRRYAVIAENCNVYKETSGVSEEVEEILSRKMVNDVGYYYDIEKGIVVWKIGDSTNAVWVIVSNHEWVHQNETQIAYIMRRIMVFYQELNEKIFNPENEDYLNELNQMTKELNIFHSKKIFSHTKEDIEMLQFKQTMEAFESQREYEECYPSYILNLLADVNVSRCYRESMTKAFYTDYYDYVNVAKWGDLCLLQNGRKYIYQVIDHEKVCIKLKVEDIELSDRILCKPTPSSIKELMLLLYAIILNAAEKKRGVKIKTNVQDNEKDVIVTLKKSEGWLSISNENMNDNIDVEQLTRDLKKLPESEEQGISMWSMSRYIKKCISTYLMDKIKKEGGELENVLKQCGEKATKGKLTIFRQKVEEMLSDKYEIQYLTFQEEGKKYFQIKLPIFMDLYN